MNQSPRKPRMRSGYRGKPPAPDRLGLGVVGTLDVPEPEWLANRMASSRYGFTSFERGWVYGQWYCGTPWKPASYWGQFPATFIRRVMTMFPVERMLHLCCGHSHIPGALNVDKMPTPAADLVADAESLPLADSSFSVVLIDPPYSTEDSQRYGVARLISSQKALREMRRVLVPGGYVLWLDERYPTYKRENWQLCGLIGIVTGFERRARFLSMFRSTKAADVAVAA